MHLVAAVVLWRVLCGVGCVWYGPFLCLQVDWGREERGVGHYPSCGEDGTLGRSWSGEGWSRTQLAPTTEEGLSPPPPPSHPLPPAAVVSWVHSCVVCVCVCVSVAADHQQTPSLTMCKEVCVCCDDTGTYTMYTYVCTYVAILLSMP